MGGRELCMYPPWLVVGLSCSAQSRQKDLDPTSRNQMTLKSATLVIDCPSAVLPGIRRRGMWRPSILKSTTKPCQQCWSSIRIFTYVHCKIYLKVLSRETLSWRLCSMTTLRSVSLQKKYTCPSIGCMLYLRRDNNIARHQMAVTVTPLRCIGHAHILGVN